MTAATFDRELSDSLKRAADYVMGYVQHEAPSQRIRESLRVLKNRDGTYQIRSDRPSADATDRNLRHPVYGHGPRKQWGWALTDKNHPEYEGWVERGAEKSTDPANEKFAEDVATAFVVSSPYLERG